MKNNKIYTHLGDVIILFSSLILLSLFLTEKPILSFALIFGTIMGLIITVIAWKFSVN